MLELPPGTLTDGRSFLARGLGLSPHFNSMRQGVVKLPDMVYFLGLTGVFLTLNNLWLEGRRH